MENNEKLIYIFGLFLVFIISIHTYKTTRSRNIYSIEINKIICPDNDCDEDIINEKEHIIMFDPYSEEDFYNYLKYKREQCGIKKDIRTVGTRTTG